MIPVTKPFFPPIEEYQERLTGIWERQWLTNRGPLVNELEREICKKIECRNLLFVSNGTIALQIAIKALELSGEIITTPFSYVATTTSILWENCQPIFCDIDINTMCIDPEKIEALITPATTGILATHVYGVPCDVEKIEAIAKRNNLKVIYDAAHSFGVKIQNECILNFGDVSTCSFHATKLFHTVEGGSITVRDKKLLEKIALFHSFGHIGDDYISNGINGKNSEIHAAMGLCNLLHLDNIIAIRKSISLQYSMLLNHLNLKRPIIPSNVTYNYSYYPVFFENEEQLINVKSNLELQGINTRRYFFPSLNNLPYLKKRNSCPVSEELAKRVLCLPLYVGLGEKDVVRISEVISDTVRSK